MGNSFIVKAGHSGLSMLEQGEGYTYRMSLLWDNADRRALLGNRDAILLSLVMMSQVKIIVTHK